MESGAGPEHPDVDLGGAELALSDAMRMSQHAATRDRRERRSVDRAR